MSVDIVSRGAGKRVPVRRLKQMARRVLGLLNQNRVELSLALVGNREIQELNARFRNKNKPTDVLSFPSGERLSTTTQILGDVVISVEQAEKQARKRRRTLNEEVGGLLIHGILHLLGYDHERSPKEAKIMRGIERKIHRRLCEKRGLRV